MINEYQFLYTDYKKSLANGENLIVINNYPSDDRLKVWNLVQQLFDWRNQFVTAMLDLAAADNFGFNAMDKFISAYFDINNKTFEIKSTKNGIELQFEQIDNSSNKLHFYPPAYNDILFLEHVIKKSGNYQDEVKRLVRKIIDLANIDIDKPCVVIKNSTLEQNSQMINFLRNSKR